MTYAPARAAGFVKGRNMRIALLDDDPNEIDFVNRMPVADVECNKAIDCYRASALPRPAVFRPLDAFIPGKDLRACR